MWYILSSVLLDTIENTLTVVVVMNVSAINKSLSSYTQWHAMPVLLLHQNWNDNFRRENLKMCLLLYFFSLQDNYNRKKQHDIKKLE